MKLHPLFVATGLGLLSLTSLRAADVMIPLAFTPENMDKTVDPRVDFSKYAWGGWASKTQIPSDKSRWGTGDMLGQNNWNRIRGILEDAAANPGAVGGKQQKIGDFYASAMDEAAIEAAGMTPLAPRLLKIEAIKNLHDLGLYLADAHAHAVSGLFGTFPYADQKKNDTIILNVSQSGLSLPTKDYYLDEKYAKFVPQFTEHVAAMFKLAGDSEENAKANAATVVMLETEIAKISKSITELRDPIANYNKLSVDEAAALFPAFPFKAYLRAVDVPASETHLNIGQPKFFEGLNTLLTAQPLQSWKTYLRWHAINSAAPFLSSAFENESFRFFGTVLNGTPAQEPRWQRAAKVLDARIGFLVGEIYVGKYFPPEVKARLEEMIQNMRDVLKDRIAGLDWMTESTKKKALEKLGTFRVVVGYPPSWRDYSALTITRSSYYANVENSALFENQRQLAKFGKPFDKTEWLRTPQQVNAYYQPSAGQLVFLAGILQAPYFDPSIDDAVNYGAIVAVIGHEISHGFDDKGRLYDAQGNLADWWTKEDADAFTARAGKLVTQFDNYEVLPGLKVNGKQTLGENIGDLGGVSIAYEAFQRSIQNKRLKEIDGLTPNQRFFISWAQVWRTLYRDDALRRYVASDVHAPGTVRSMGPLVNLQEFFDAFGIKEGDPMWVKPEDRAKIW
ncbi:M13 family metallopeptidase [Oleiharenicola lentus]|uniref:M13 family metallopeptidase n=1 Tax=Oleiharenicola lentus TaxID=2508720 RepID=UPI003F67C76D